MKEKKEEEEEEGKNWLEDAKKVCWSAATFVFMSDTFSHKYKILLHKY